MKLKSGHEVQELPKEKEEKQKDLFKAYEEGVIKLCPGNWFYTRGFVDYANRIYEFKFRPTDTLIMTFPKCGTTWMQEIIWNMKHPSNLDDPIQGISVNTRCTFLEADFLTKFLPKPGNDSDVMQYFKKYCPGKDPSDGVFIQLSENIPDPRIFKTHLPFSLLPPNLLDTCKVVFVVRNPKDACSSFYNHSRVITAHNYVGDFDTFLDLFIKDEVLYGPYWKFLEEGWYRKKHPNFYLVHFEDLKNDPVTEISYLNDFLQTNLSQELIKRVAENTSFSSMKARDAFSGGADVNNPFLDRSKGTFFRSGKSGGWKNELTDEQNRKMDEWITKNTKGGNNFEVKYAV